MEDLMMLCILGFIVIVGLLIVTRSMGSMGGNAGGGANLGRWGGNRPNYDNPNVRSRGGIGGRQMSDDRDNNNSNNNQNQGFGNKGGFSGDSNQSFTGKGGSSGSGFSGGGSSNKSDKGGFGGGSSSSSSGASRSSGGDGFDNPNVKSRGGIGRNNKKN